MDSLSREAFCRGGKINISHRGRLARLLTGPLLKAHQCVRQASRRSGGVSGSLFVITNGSFCLSNCGWVWWMDAVEGGARQTREGSLSARGRRGWLMRLCARSWCNSRSAFEVGPLPWRSKAVDEPLRASPGSYSHSYPLRHLRHLRHFRLNSAACLGFGRFARPKIRLRHFAAVAALRGLWSTKPPTLSVSPKGIRQ
jgi:hypothetical protein